MSNDFQFPAKDSLFWRSPALRQQEKDYPERFERRVPVRIKVLRNVHGHPVMTTPGTFATMGKIYEAWTNSHGAVSAICDNGVLLGLYPEEFEVLEYFEFSQPGQSSLDAIWAVLREYERHE